MLGLALLAFYLGYFLLMWKKSHELNFRISSMEDFAPFISVIVPAYNEEKTVARKLENLRQQVYPNIEVIVVNDGSTDDTVNMVQKFIDENEGQLPVQLISTPRRGGKASAINYAWQSCKGEIVILSDADTILEEGAIKQIVKNFHNPRVGAVTGKLCMRNYEESSSTELEKSYRNIFDILRFGESVMDSTPVFNGALVALRRELFESLESDTLADDTEISLLIREKGYKAIFDPNAAVYAFTPKSFKFRMKQKIRRGEGIIQSMVRHRRLLFNPTYGKYGLIILPCEFLMHSIFPALILLTFLLFFFLLVSASLSMYIIIALALGAVFLGLTPLVLRHSSKNQSLINPVKLLVTFLEHQVFLILGLFSLLLRKGNVKWEKIKD